MINFVFILAKIGKKRVHYECRREFPPYLTGNFMRLKFLMLSKRTPGKFSLNLFYNNFTLFVS